MLLEYALGEERSYLWVLSQQGLESFTLPPRAEIEAATRRFYDDLTERNRAPAGENAAARSRRVQEADRALPDAGTALSRMLLGPAVALLASQRLIIVPDAALHYLPFSALPDPDGPTGRAYTEPLIVNHEIVHVPSASVLVTLRRETARRAPSPRSIAVLADPVFSERDPRVQGALTSADTLAAGRQRADIERSSLEVGIGASDTGLPRLLFARREAQSVVGSVGADDALVPK